MKTAIRRLATAALALTCTIVVGSALGDEGQSAKPQAAETEAEDEGNLIANGSFETPNEAEDGPAHWQPVDGLVLQWTTDPDAPKRGKVIRMNTAVAHKQAVAWWIERFVHGKPIEEAPEPKSGSGYSHIGADIGGFMWSDYIAIKEGGAYRVSVDAKGPKAMVFIRGYDRKPELFFGDEEPAVVEYFRKARGEPTTDAKGKPIRYRPRYRYTTYFETEQSDDWKTFTHTKPRHPNSREITEDVRWIRIKLYAIWPPDVYWFDNVRVVEVEPDAEQAKPTAEEADIEEGKVIR